MIFITSSYFTGRKRVVHVQRDTFGRVTYTKCGSRLLQPHTVEGGEKDPYLCPTCAKASGLVVQHSVSLGFANEYVVGIDSTDEEEIDYVNHPPHYNNHPSGIECITIAEHYNFNVGNAIKYLWRANDKGATIEDLRKARWYVNREIQRLEHDA